MNTHAAERRLGIDELERGIVDLTARMTASAYELLVMIREFDERAGWLGWGFESCAQWLHWRCDSSRGAAREKVRVAHALKELAEISLAFSEGKLSYSKVRALARVAKPSNEGALLAFALSTTAARVEERCRQMRNTSPEALDGAKRAHARRSLRVWRDAQRGTLTLTVALPVETGELVCQALDKAVEAEDAPGPEFEAETWRAQQADALVSIARHYLSGGSEGCKGTGDDYQVVVHVDGAALRGEEGRADLPVESVKRLSCDGGVVRVVDGLDGEPLSVGRKQRRVPAALRRALWARDGGCSFPGCRHTRFVAAHHVRHWAEGGEASLENTMLLCSRHHRLVHEGGYAVRKDHRGRWYFRRPDGRAIPAHGYQPEDMLDETVSPSLDNMESTHMDNDRVSAEAPCCSSEYAGEAFAPVGVREAESTRIYQRRSVGVCSERLHRLRGRDVGYGGRKDMLPDRALSGARRARVRLAGDEYGAGEHGYDASVLARDVDAVGCEAAPAAAHARGGVQELALAHRGVEAQVSVDGDGALAMGVRGETEGGIGETEDDAAVAGAVEIEMSRGDAHAHAGVPLGAVDELDAERPGERVARVQSL